MQQSATQPKPAVQADAANTAQIKSALMNQVINQAHFLKPLKKSQDFILLVWQADDYKPSRETQQFHHVESVHFQSKSHSERIFIR